MLDRIAYRMKWVRKLAAVYRSRNRQFLAFPPGHFASPLPDYAELGRDAGKLFGPPPRELPGIDTRDAEQLSLLKHLAGFAGDLPFNNEPTPGLRYHFGNEFFPAPDGVPLAAVLRHLRPRRVVEVGSGYSSALMLDVNERFLGGATQFTFVEPYPDRLRTLLTQADRVRIHECRVQDLPRGVFAELAAGDMLFVDSSHVLKAGADVNFLLFDVLPTLPAGVVVHVHDVFWPFEYPRAWFDRGYAWNEAYAVRAFLTFNTAFRVMLFPSYLEAFHAGEWAAALPGATRRPRHAPELGGASLYLVRA